jgi:hypothetical protein
MRACVRVRERGANVKYEPMTDFLSSFVPGYQNGAHFVPQDTITNGAFKLWLAEFYGAGHAEEPVALDREVLRLRTVAGLSGKALQRAIQEYVKKDSRVILQNIHDEPGFWAAVRLASSRHGATVAASGVPQVVTRLFCVGRFNLPLPQLTTTTAAAAAAACLLVFLLLLLLAACLLLACCLLAACCTIPVATMLVTAAGGTAMASGQDHG